MTDCNNLENLEKIIGYTFKDKNLLMQAPTFKVFSQVIPASTKVLIWSMMTKGLMKRNMMQRFYSLLS